MNHKKNCTIKILNTHLSNPGSWPAALPPHKTHPPPPPPPLHSCAHVPRVPPRPPTGGARIQKLTVIKKKNFQYKNANGPRCNKTILIKGVPCTKKKLQLSIISHVSITKSPLTKVSAPERLVLCFNKQQTKQNAPNSTKISNHCVVIYFTTPKSILKEHTQIKTKY